MRSTKEFSGTAGEDIQQAPHSDDNDFSLRMGKIGKSVKLLWPANIERILGGDDNSRLAMRLAVMAQEIIGRTADDNRDEIANKKMDGSEQSAT